MIIYKEPFPSIEGIASVALGTFDGVHKGHKIVIKKAVELAKESGGLSAVWCFSSPPKRFFVKNGPEPISTPEEKAAAIEELGVDILIMPELSAEILSVDAEKFLEKLSSSLSPKSVVCGFNYSFGAKALGTTETLSEFFKEHGVSVNVIPPVLTDDGTPVSSTLIRKRLELGACIDELL